MTQNSTGSATPRVYFLTLGCPKNEADSDAMSGLLGGSGFHLVDALDEADVVVLNTCGFIQDAVQESIDTALELADWRDAQPGRRLVLVGCLVTRYADDLAEALIESDAFVSLAEEPQLAQVLGRLTGFAPRKDAEHRPTARVSAYLKVSDGCHRTCAYCTIPAIRGPYRSTPLTEIVQRARESVERGAKELVLIGQDISAYGRDLEETVGLPEVIKDVAAIDGVEWVRLMYVQPDGVTPELVEVIANEPKVCHYLDIPLQHASRRVLRAMKRRGSGARFLGMIERLREAVPDIVLRTTFIAGFPGETRDDVSELVDFVRAAAFDYAGVFPYSPEEGTAGAAMPGLPDRRTRLRRAQRVRDAADEVGLARAEERIGAVFDVLAEGLDDDGVAVGRWRGQAPEIDGLVLLDRDVTAGELVRVRITDAAGYDLEGEVLA